MAGRIRTVKPEWLEDEKLSMASLEARVLSVAVLLLADDHGRGRAHPAHVGSVVFPTSTDQSGLARKALDDLAEIGFLVLYEVRGQSYYEVRNWKKHQRVDKPGAPRVPAPSDPEATPSSRSRTPRECLANDSRTIRESIPHAPDSGPQSEANGRNDSSAGHSRTPRESLANDSRLISDLRSPIPTTTDDRRPLATPTAPKRKGGLEVEALETIRAELGELFASIRDPGPLVLQLLTKARVDRPNPPDRIEVLRFAARAVAQAKPPNVAASLHLQVEALREEGALDGLRELEAALATSPAKPADANKRPGGTVRKAEIYG